MYNLQFLYHADVVEKYTTGDCKFFATQLAEKFGGKVVGIGSNAFENYTTFDVVDGAFTTEVHTNPMHYLTQLGSEYVDVTGIFRSLEDVLEHYSMFYKFSLPEIAAKIEMKLWTEPKKIISSSTERCTLQVARESKELVEQLTAYCKQAGGSNQDRYEVQFIVPYPVNNDQFCRALQIVFNAATFRDDQGRALARVGEKYVDIGGILQPSVVSFPIHPIDLTASNNDDAVWSAASIKKELLFGPLAFLDEWYHRPLFPKESIAYLYLPNFILDHAPYPFKGALLESDLPEDVKEYIREGDLYSAISEYVAYGDTKYYQYDTNAQIALLFELTFNVVSKEPFVGLFTKSDLTSNLFLGYIQKMILLGEQLGHLNEERDIIRPDRGYKYLSYDVDTDWILLLTGIIGRELNKLHIPGLVKTFVTEKKDRIWYDPEAYPANIAIGDLAFFMSLASWFRSVIYKINKHCKFFFGYRMNKLVNDEKGYYLRDFSESIYKVLLPNKIDPIDISNQRPNELAKELIDKYRVFIFDLGMEEHYVDIDMLCFYHFSMDYFRDEKIKSHCQWKIEEILPRIRLY